MITRAEELAALMIYGGKENAKYRIANDLVMKGMPKEVAAKITDGVLFKDITVDGAGYKISDMDLPAARGIFSKVENFTAMNINIENVTVGSEDAIANVAGTGVFIGQASGNLSLEELPYDVLQLAQYASVGVGPEVLPFDAVPPSVEQARVGLVCDAKVLPLMVPVS